MESKEHFAGNWKSFALCLSAKKGSPSRTERARETWGVVTTNNVKRDPVQKGGLERQLGVVITNNVKKELVQKRKR